MSTDQSDDELLKRIRERASKDLVAGHVFPAQFRSRDQDRLRTFVRKVASLALEMGVRFDAIDPASDEDRKALMKLIGATSYHGTLTWNHETLNWEEPLPSTAKK